LKLDKNGKVAVMKKIEVSVPAIVKAVNTTLGKVEFKTPGEQDKANEFGNDAANANKSYLIIKNGKVAALKDLAADDLVWVSANANGYDYKVSAVSRKVAGTVSQASADLKKVTVGGTEYSLGKKDYGADGKGRAIRMVEDSVSGMVYKFDTADVSKAVTLYLDQYGYIKAFKFGAGEAWTYGLVTRKESKIWPNKAMIEILNVDGSKTTYVVSDDVADSSEWGNINASELVKFRLASDGSIKEIQKPNLTTKAVQAVDTEYDRVKINNAWYYAGSSVVFSTYGGYKVYKFADVEGELQGKTVDYLTDDYKLTYMVTNQPITGGPANWGYVVAKGYNADGGFIKVNVKGTEYTYTVHNTDAMNCVVDSVYDFTIIGGKIRMDAQKPTAAETTYDTRKVIQGVDGSLKWFKVGTEWFVTTGDTVYWDVASGAPVKADFSALAVGREVTFGVDALGKVQWVIVK